MKRGMHHMMKHAAQSMVGGRARRVAYGLTVACALLLAGGARGEGIGVRFDVTCAQPITDAQGVPLAGSNLSAVNFGYAAEEGTLIQVIDAGPNGVADLPNLDGSPAGDDVLFAATAIGEGMAPNLSQSGRFSTSFYPPPPPGRGVYVRAFNGPTLASATKWGQSNVHTVEGCRVLDASVLGLWATTQPKGTDPLRTDTDGDGHSDFTELLANTAADDAGDLLTATDISDASRVQVEGRAGRQYRLVRSTDALDGTMKWTPVASSGVLTANEELILTDPVPPETHRAFYRVEVSGP